MTKIEKKINDWSENNKNLQLDMNSEVQLNMRTLSSNNIVGLSSLVNNPYFSIIC
jgi:hypothetical protein